VYLLVYYVLLVCRHLLEVARLSLAVQSVHQALRVQS
jgi:hypothetical protein